MDLAMILYCLHRNFVGHSDKYKNIRKIAVKKFVQFCFCFHEGPS